MTIATGLLRHHRDARHINTAVDWEIINGAQLHPDMFSEDSYRSHRFGNSPDQSDYKRYTRYTGQRERS